MECHMIVSKPILNFYWLFCLNKRNVSQTLTGNGEAICLFYFHQVIAFCILYTFDILCLFYLFRILQYQNMAQGLFKHGNQVQGHSPGMPSNSKNVFSPAFPTKEEPGNDIYPTPPLGQDMIQGQFLSKV